MSSPANSDVFWEYTARIRVEAGDVGSTFSVIIFIGNVPSDPEDWLICPEFVGKLSVLVTGRMYAKRTATNNVSEGFVNLNSAISKRSGLGTLDPAEVVPYLKRTFNWRVQKSDGSVVPEPESLEVVVFGQPMSFPPGSMFPLPSGERKRFDTITYGRPGGSTEEPKD